MAERPIPQGYTLGRLLAAVLAIAVILSVSLGWVPGLVESRLTSPDNPAPEPPTTAAADQPADPAPAVVAVLPLGLDEKVAGPLLASMLRRYLPDTTNAHADGLRDTLPPGEDPRMIVILPDEQATF